MINSIYITVIITFCIVIKPLTFLQAPYYTAVTGSVLQGFLVFDELKRNIVILVSAVVVFQVMIQSVYHTHTHYTQCFMYFLTWPLEKTSNKKIPYY